MRNRALESYLSAPPNSRKPEDGALYLDLLEREFKNPGPMTWRLLYCLTHAPNLDMLDKLVTERKIQLREEDLFHIYRPVEFETQCVVTYEKIIRETGILYCSESGHYNYLVDSEVLDKLRQAGDGGCPVTRRPINWCISLCDLRDDEFAFLLDKNNQLRDLNSWKKEFPESLDKFLESSQRNRKAPDFLILEGRFDRIFQVSHAGSTPILGLAHHVFVNPSFHPSEELKNLTSQLFSKITAEVLFSRLAESNYSLMILLLLQKKNPDFVNLLFRNNPEFLKALPPRALLEMLFCRVNLPNLKISTFLLIASDSRIELLQKFFRGNPGCVSAILPAEFAQYLVARYSMAKNHDFSLLQACAAHSRLGRWLVSFLQHYPSILQHIPPKEWSRLDTMPSAFMNLLRNPKNHPFLLDLVNRHPIILHELLSRISERNALSAFFVKQRESISPILVERLLRLFLYHPFAPLSLVIKELKKQFTFVSSGSLSSSVWSFTSRGFSSRQLLLMNNPDQNKLSRMFGRRDDWTSFLLKAWFGWGLVTMLAIPEIILHPYLLNPLTHPELGWRASDHIVSRPQQSFELSGLVFQVSFFGGMFLSARGKAGRALQLNYLCVALFSLLNRLFEEESSYISAAYTLLLWVPIFVKLLSLSKPPSCPEEHFVEIMNETEKDEDPDSSIFRV